MKEYILFLREGRPIGQKTQLERKAEMVAWEAYLAQLSQGGYFIGGIPLAKWGSTITSSEIIARPVKSAKYGIIGDYLLIIRAESHEKAVKLAEACPHISNTGSIEVREIVQMPAV